MYGDETHQPEFAAAERIVRRRSQMVEARQRYLMKRLEMAEESEKRELEITKARETITKRMAEHEQRMLRLGEARAREQQALLAQRQKKEAAVAPRATPVTPAAKPPVTTEPHPGRNEHCPCGSGKKYKKCHGSGVTPGVTPTARAA